jgi:hypothetical protein
VSEIPPAVLERGQRAFVSVLRGDFPDACFVVRDGAVRPEDADVADKVGAGAAVDLDAVEKAAQNRAATSDIKVSPSAESDPPAGMRVRRADRCPTRSRASVTRL